MVMLKSPLGTSETIRNLIRVPKVKMLIKVKYKSNFNSIFNFAPKIYISTPNLIPITLLNQFSYFGFDEICEISS